MARTTNAKCKLCRREGEKLFLRGTRCDSPACSFERRPKPPGAHGDRRVRLTDYGIHLREKQKAKRIYGLFERQFRRYFETALRMPGNTGDNLVAMLESRLDNVVFRMGFATSRAQARQLIKHGHILVNDKRATIPSQLVKTADVIRPVTKEGSTKLVTELAKGTDKGKIPSWVAVSDNPLSGRIVHLPTREELAIPMDVQLIVEFCSK